MVEAGPAEMAVPWTLPVLLPSGMLLVLVTAAARRRRLLNRKRQSAAARRMRKTARIACGNQHRRQYRVSLTVKSAFPRHEQ